MRVPRAFALLQLALAAAMDYEAVYEALYAKAGYHAGTGDTHGIPNVHTVQRRYNAEVGSVLDVGCSHGDVVQRFWNLKKRASGMDVSPSAVKRAAATRCPGGECDASRCVDACFRAGSATAIPWANASFDAIVSSDVLEHIAADDVPALVREFHRVTRRLVLLLIAPREEINRKPINDLKRLAQAGGAQAKPLQGVTALHLTVRDLGWWSDQFVRHGPFEVLQRSSGASHQLVLRRRDTEPPRRPRGGPLNAARHASKGMLG